MLVQLDHVKKIYDDFALELNMQIPENCVTGLIGANGAGKSTAFKLMLGLIRPDYGTVNVLDRKASDLTVMEKERDLCSKQDCQLCCQIKRIGIYKKCVRKALRFMTGGLL